MEAKEEWVTGSTLLAQLQDFDQQTAWQCLAEYFRPALVRLSLSQGLDAREAEDVAQETLIEFARLYKMGRYERGKGRLKSWILGIAKNKLAHAHRSRRKRNVLPAADLGLSTEWMDDVPAQTEPQWDREWKRLTFEKCVERVRSTIDERTWRVFEMTVLGRRSVQEAASSLRMSSSQVYNARHRVLSRLRALADQFNDC